MIHFRIYHNRIAVPLCKARSDGRVKHTSTPDAAKVDCPVCKSALAQQRAS